jgi:hypothetical protein
MVNLHELYKNPQTSKSKRKMQSKFNQDLKVELVMRTVMNIFLSFPFDLPTVSTSLSWFPVLYFPAAGYVLVYCLSFRS